MSNDFEAIIRGDSERAATWRAVLGTETVKIKSPLPVAVSLPGDIKTTAYQVDICLLTAEQRQRLVAHLAARFGYTVHDVDRDLDDIGCPILADDVVVTVHNPQRWFDVAGDDYGDGTGDGDLDYDEDDDWEDDAEDGWNDPFDLWGYDDDDTLDF